MTVNKKKNLRAGEILCDFSPWEVRKGNNGVGYDCFYFGRFITSFLYRSNALNWLQVSAESYGVKIPGNNEFPEEKTIITLAK